MSGISKPKILFLIPTLSGGGAERVLLNLLRNIPDGLFLIEVVSIFRDQLPPDLLHISYRYMFRQRFRGNVHLFKLATPDWLFKHFIGNKNDYDIVISYLHSPTMRIAGGALGGKARLINWIHNEFKSKKELLRLFRTKKEFERIMRSYDRTVFVAESARKSTIAMFPFLIPWSRTIYNTIDSDEILIGAQEELEDSNFANDTLNLISVGRFSEVKAFDRLLRIVRRIADNGQKVHLHLLGKGPLENAYKAEIKRLGISNMVTFPGFVENPYKYVAKADLFICSSIHEGFSTAVTEALIVGTPVVSTLCSGMEELLGKNGEYGIITPNDEQSLSDAVLKISTEPAQLRELAEKAFDRGKQFSKEQTVSQVVSLFNELLNQ